MTEAHAADDAGSSRGRRKRPARLSAGLLLYRRRHGVLEVLLAHPGGPYFAKKDLGAWTIPKGLVGEGEDPLEAAKREFTEETSFPIETKRFLPLGEVVQKGGKTVIAWAFEGDCDPARLASNCYEIEWPPKSGQWRSYPEVDRARWCLSAEARAKLNPAQAKFLERLERALGSPPAQG